MGADELVTEGESIDFRDFDERLPCKQDSSARTESYRN